MATTTTKPQSPKADLIPAPVAALLKSLMPDVYKLLPPDIAPEQFRAACWLELTGSRDLTEVVTESIRDTIIYAANYGLMPGRDCHFLAFKQKKYGGRKGYQCVANYFGLIRTLDRTGKVRRAFAHPVHEGDEFDFDLFQGRPVHKPAITLGKKPGKELFYYGAIMFKDGTCAFEVMTLDDLDGIRKRAPAHDSGPWVSDPVMMKRKSCIKRVEKYVKLTPDVRVLFADDAAREREDIPPTRHQQNIIDLFGEPSNPTVYGLPQQGSATEEHDPQTGEVISPGAGQSDLWQKEEAWEKASNAGVEGSN